MEAFVAFVGETHNWDFSVELAATSLEFWNCEAATVEMVGVGAAGVRGTGLTAGSLDVEVAFVVEFVVEFFVAFVCSVI